MKNRSFILLLIVINLFLDFPKANAQQYRFKQSSSLMGMKTETTVYVKGMRKRTESGSMMGMPPQPITIEQCDLQRTIKINDKKKLYCIVPFNKENDDVEEEKEIATTPPPKNTAKKPVKTDVPKYKKLEDKNGGTIYMDYAIIDTGERKNMYGFTARHIWTVMKMHPSVDACSMKDSMLIKTDGWYIDLPKFNCPIKAQRPDRRMLRQMQKPNEAQEEDTTTCKDKFVNRHSGKGKLGFVLSEIRTMKMGNGQAQQTEFSTDVQTVDFSTNKIDSMLFEIPIGYNETKNEADLQDKINMADMMKEAFKNGVKMVPPKNNEKPADGKRIGVYLPTGDEQINAADLQTYLAQILNSGKIDAVEITSEADAKSKNCDFLLNTNFPKIKAGSKLGGLLKAIKNADPNAASSFNVEADLVLTKLADGSQVEEQKVDNKYDGKANDAAKKALDEAARKILKGLK